MRILYFTRDYTPHDHRFLSALARTEHQVAYLQLERRGHSLEDRPLPPEIEQIHWSGGCAPASLRDGPRLLGDLKRVIRQVKPDLIQAGPIQRSAFLSALSGFRPLISMSWGYDLIYDAQRSAWWRWATRYTLKHSSVMVGDCNTIRQMAVSYGMPDERIVTFPWGIDLQHFPERQAENRPEIFTLLSTRSWEPIYGVDIIARAFVKAAQCKPELRLIMLGNGSLAPMIHKILSPAVLPEATNGQNTSASFSRVIFPGQVSHEDLPRYYHSADLYVAATHSDGTSISLLEALASGRPALVSDIPGNREWITPGQNGWLFPDGDAEALAQAIINAVDQRQRLAEMGHAARNLAEQRADWDKNFQALLGAYELAMSV